MSINERFLEVFIRWLFCYPYSEKKDVYILFKHDIFLLWEKNNNKISLYQEHMLKPKQQNCI
jgi:hypothetical protein